MKNSYTLEECLDASLLELRDMCVDTGSIKHATPEFLQRVKEAEARCSARGAGYKRF